MDKDPTMGGLDALVAAASSVSAGKNRNNQDQAAAGGAGAGAAGTGAVEVDMIDPALQNEVGDRSDPVETLSGLLSNPVVVGLIAEYNAKKSHRTPSLYAQLLSSSASSNGAGSHVPPTPAQQTRYGRISRPPVHPLPGTPGKTSEAGLSNAGGQSQAQGQSDSQIQAIKDALENVVREDEGDVSYDSLAQMAVSGQANGSTAPGQGWGDAATLAQAADASHREAFNRVAAMGANVTMSAPGSANGASTAQKKGRGGKKRGMSEMSVDDHVGEDDELDEERDEDLPAWPLPPQGKGGRKNMPRDELLARRRARNRVAAQQSRQKKKQYFGTLEERLAEKDQVYNQLDNHCRNLERELELCRQTITDAGLPLPNFIPEVYVAPTPPTQENHIHDSIVDGLQDHGSAEMPSEIPFHDLFNIDEDENDDEFIPPSSPKRDSDFDDSDADDDIDVDAGPAPKRARRGGKGKGKQARSPSPSPAPDDDDDEEEDLFLPIVDVPVPPRPNTDEEHQALVKQAMSELHVETADELMNVVKKMVETAEYGGVTEDQVGMLSKLLALGQAQGVSVW